MCFPFAIPLALMAAGTVANYFGEKQASHASENAFNSERDRQSNLSDQQTARFQDSLDKTQAMLDPAAVAAAANKREASLASAIVPASQTNAAYLPGSDSAPSVVATAADKAGEGSKATSLNLAHAIAALGGTGDQLQTLNTGIGRNSESIGQLGGFKAGSMGVLDSEMQAAAQRGSFLRGIGGLAQTIGGAWLGARAAHSLARAAKAVGSAGKAVGSGASSAFAGVPV